jgi:Rap1a immunity proteins
VKKNNRYLGFTLLLIFACSQVSARGERFYTGVELKLLCESYKEQCLQYIAGVYDGFSMVYAFIDPKKKAYLMPEIHHCPPKDLTTQQLHTVVVEYLNEAKLKRHSDANMQVYKAVLRAFPCTDG